MNGLYDCQQKVSLVFPFIFPRIFPLLCLERVPGKKTRGGERDLLFVAERYRIEHQDLCGQDDAGGASVQQGRAQEAHRAAVIHWRAREVEGETGDGGVHEDAEVVAQIGARDAERVGAAQHE